VYDNTQNIQRTLIFQHYREHIAVISWISSSFVSVFQRYNDSLFHL